MPAVTIRRIVKGLVWGHSVETVYVQEDEMQYIYSNTCEFSDGGNTIIVDKDCFDFVDYEVLEVHKEGEPRSAESILHSLVKSGDVPPDILPEALKALGL